LNWRLFFFKFGLSLLSLSLALAFVEESKFAHAQVLPFISQFDQSRERPVAPKQPSAPFNFRLQSPERSPIPRAIDSIKFKLGGIRFEGSSIFDDEDLLSLYAHLFGPEIVLEDIRKVADRLEELYKRKGYFLTRVFLPPQQVKDGEFTIKIIEGYIGDIEVEGGAEATRQEVRERLQGLLAKHPVDLPSVERALLLLNDLPDIQGTGLLRAGRRVGESTLLVQLEEVKSQGLISLNNLSSVAVGPFVVNIVKQLKRVFLDHDELTVQVGTSGDGKELINGSFRYAMPIGRDGLTASFGTLMSRVRPSTGNVESNVIAQTLRARYPLIRARDGSLFIDAGVTDVSSRTDVNGQEDFFKEKATTRDVSLQVVDARTVLGVTQFSIGTSRANATHAPSPAITSREYDKDLKRVTYAMKHQIQFENGLFGQIEAQGQWANRPLLSSERIGFGGGSFGRGFAPSTIVGDKGLGGGLELGWARRLELPGGLDEGIGQVFLFRDYARAEDMAMDGSVVLRKKIASRGLGIRWQSSGGARTSIYFAKPDDVDGQTQQATQKMYVNVAIPW
jgi:hemolysin activation/secretion protein